MKRFYLPVSPLALATILGVGTAFSTSAAAQETPPVSATVAAPPPAAAPARPSVVFSPRSEVAQPLPPRPAPPVEAVAQPDPAPRATRTVRPATRPATPRVVAAAPARPAAAPPAAEPVAVETAPSAPLPDPIAEAPETVAAPAAESGSTALLDWLFLGVALAVVIGMAAIIVSRRRRRRVEAESEDFPYSSYVGTDEAGTPVPEVDLDERPWIRLAVQPVAAEASGDEQKVEYEVIVENEGHVPARDVTVLSFMKGASALHDSEGQRDRIDLAPGERRPLPGSISVPEGVNPKIVADARYPLPDGREGHLAALFGLELSDDLPPAEVEDVLERV